MDGGVTPTSSATARIETCSMSPVLISSRSVAARISSRSRSPCPRLARRRREGAGVVGRAASVGSATGSALLDGGEYSALGGDRSGSGLDLQRLLGFLDAEAVVEAPKRRGSLPVRPAGKPHE